MKGHSQSQGTVGGEWGLRGMASLGLVNLKYVNIYVWTLSEKNKFELK